MANEIETLDELIEGAELREVVIHEVVAHRETVADPEAFGLPSEELHAPGFPHEFAVLNFTTSLGDYRLGVRCQLRTRNAHGSFQVDAEAVFSLPVPISTGHLDIIQHFIGEVGAPAVFPYIRAAVAALAAQLSVTASPLPMLRPGDVALGIEEDSTESECPPDLLAAGKMEITNDDGSVEQVIEFFVDARTGELVRFGGEDVQSDLLDVMAELAPQFAESGAASELTWEQVVHTMGEDHAHLLAEQVRATEGDAAGDAAVAEIDEAVRSRALEAAGQRLGEALTALHITVAVTQEHIGESGAAGDDRDALKALLAATETVMVELDEFRAAGG